MEKIYIRDEFIKLGQALKLAGLVEMGTEAKEVITEGFVKVNGKTEYQRGKKLYENDKVEYNGESFTVKKKDNI